MIGSLTNGGLGYNYYDLVNAVGGYEQCDPRDAECVLRNQEKQVQVSSYWEATSGSAAGQAVPTGFKVVLDSGEKALAEYRTNDNPNYLDPIIAVYNPTVVAQGYGMTATPTGGASISFSFATTRGGSGATVYPGDTWKIEASGGAPGSTIYVSGTMKGAPFTNTVAGQFDGNGKFSKSGTFSVGDVGVWTQQYTTAAGSVIGSANFTVKPPVVVAVPSTPLSQTTGSGTTVTGTPSTGGTTPGESGETNPSIDDTNTTNLTSFDLFGERDTNIRIGNFEVGSYTALALVALIGGVMFMSRGK